MASRPGGVRVGMHFGASVRYRTFVLEPGATALRPLRAWSKNLILDSGLDSVAGNGWAASISFFAKGTGTTPTSTDSGATTLSRAGTTVTASAGFFTSGMVGMLIRWDTGEEAYIQSFTDSTHVETVSSGTIAAAEGTVYAVNQVALDAQSGARSNTASGLGPNQVTYNAGTNSFVYEVTRIFAAEGAPVTIREVGWAPASTGNIFGRDVLSGGGDSLLTGQQYVITVQLNVEISPITVTAVANVGTGGIDTAGDAVIESVAISGVGNSAPAYTLLDPVTANRVCLAPATWTQSVESTSMIDTGFTTASSPDELMALAGYVAGSFTRTQSVTFGVPAGARTIFGFWITSVHLNATQATARWFSVKFTASQSQSALQTLTVVFRKSWQRKF